MKKPLILMLTIIGTLLLVAGGAVAYSILKPLSSAELFETAVRNSISLAEDVRPYASLDISSESMKLTGELQAGMTGPSDAHLNLEIDGEIQEIDAKLGLEMIMKSEGEEDDTRAFIKINRLSSGDPEYGELLEAFMQPALNQWIDVSETDDDDTDSDTSSFEEDGPFAVLEAFDIFAPLSDLSEPDAKIFLDLVEKYNLYTVADEKVEANFRGVEATRLNVTVDKDNFIEFERELDQSLSEEAEYSPVDRELVDQLFGTDNRLDAEVYINQQRQIIGVVSRVELKDEVIEDDYQASFQNIDMSIFVEYDRTFSATVPEDALTEEEFSDLLSN